MIKAYTMPVVTKPYYELAPWMNQNLERKKYIVLSGQSTEEDVQLFLSILFGYNSIDINKEIKKAFEDLLNEEELVISGGILFTNNKKIILPSCCCGLECWKDVLDSILNRKSPWMGHDPYPTIEFLTNNTVRVWSDDYLGIWGEDLSEEEKQKFYYLDYYYDDLLKSIKNIEHHMYEFAMGPLYLWISSIDKAMAKRVSSRFCEWFSVNET